MYMMWLLYNRCIILVVCQLDPISLLLKSAHGLFYKLLPKHVAGPVEIRETCSCALYCEWKTFQRNIWCYPIISIEGERAEMRENSSCQQKRKFISSWWYPSELSILFTCWQTWGAYLDLRPLCCGLCMSFVDELASLCSPVSSERFRHYLTSIPPFCLLYCYKLWNRYWTSHTN
jgi:hypothetical protein